MLRGIGLIANSGPVLLFYLTILLFTFKHNIINSMNLLKKWNGRMSATNIGPSSNGYGPHVKETLIK